MLRHKRTGTKTSLMQEWGKRWLVEMHCDCRLARRLGLQRIQLETDCLELIQLWERKELQRSLLDPVLVEIDELRLAFSESVFKYVNRSCNKVAHVLAKQVTRTNQSEQWHEMPTLCA